MTFKKKTPAPSKNEQTKKENAYESVFPEGIIVFKPREGAPDFILCDIIITPDTLATWLNNNQEQLSETKYGEQLKLQLKESKSGSYYLSVNNYGKKD